MACGTAYNTGAYVGAYRRSHTCDSPTTVFSHLTLCVMSSRVGLKETKAAYGAHNTSITWRLRDFMTN